MMRSALGILALFIVGLPLLVRPSPVVVIAAVPAALLCVLAVATFVQPLATAAAVVALAEYALAASLTGATPDFGLALAFGSALMAFPVVLDFAARVRGAHTGDTVLSSHLRYWIAILGAAAVVTIVLVLVALGLSTIIARFPFPVASIMTAVGAALAVVGLTAPLLASRGVSR